MCLASKKASRILVCHLGTLSCCNSGGKNSLQRTEGCGSGCELCDKLEPNNINCCCCRKKKITENITAKNKKDSILKTKLAHPTNGRPTISEICRVNPISGLKLHSNREESLHA